jgi:hypothetical protein
MKNLVVFVLFSTILFASCAAIRDKRAANHQPYKPHHDKVQKQKRHR